MGREKWAMLLCAVGLLALAGCQALGFESKSARLYREAMKNNEELEGKLAVSAAEQERLKKELDDIRRKAMEQATKPVIKTGGPSEKIIKDLDESLGLIVGRRADGKPGGSLSGDILFDSGKCTIKPAGKTLLNRVAGVIKKAPAGVVAYIDGHTDADPLRVTKALYKDNYGLGAARAKSVAKYLHVQGVPEEKLVTRSFGADEPVADNKSESGKRQNRRVDISLGYAQNGAAGHSAPAKAAPKAPALKAPPIEKAPDTPIGS